MASYPSKCFFGQEMDSSTSLYICRDCYLLYDVATEGLSYRELKMYLVESKGGAIVCMFLALFFLGTWPAILTLLERRGRLPQHTYLDYTITNLLAAVSIAFTFGEIGNGTIEKPNFMDQLSQMQDNWPSILFAMGGGIVLSIGNLAAQYAWAFVGLSVTEVIDSSMTVVIGTTLNYFLDGKINNAKILFPGVGCFLIAVCLGSAVHSSNASDNNAKLSTISSDNKEEIAVIHAFTKDSPTDKDLENGSVAREKAEFGTADFLIELENRRSIKVIGKGAFIGLGITFFAGVCFSIFSPAFNLATNDQWHILRPGVPPLSVYTTFFYFSVSCFIIAVILNISFLYWPVLNSPKSSFKAYLLDWNGRGWALLAGLLCGFGNGLQFMGGIVGTSTGEHFLGCNSIWRISKIIAKNICTSRWHVVDVYHSSWSSYVFVGTQNIKSALLQYMVLMHFKSLPGK